MASKMQESEAAAITEKDVTSSKSDENTINVKSPVKSILSPKKLAKSPTSVTPKNVTFVDCDSLNELLERAKNNYYEQNDVTEFAKVNISLDDYDNDMSGLQSFAFIYYPEGPYPDIQKSYNPDWEMENEENLDKFETEVSAQSLKTEVGAHSLKTEKALEFKTDEKSSEKSSKGFLSKSPVKDILKALTLHSTDAKDKIIKEDRLCLRKIYNHTFTTVYVALLNKGTMIIKDNSITDVINFDYSLKDCIVKESGLLFRLSVRDEVSINTFYFLAGSVDLRDEWIEAINKSRDKNFKTPSIMTETKTILSEGEEEYEILKVIGRGSFGKIIKCQYVKKGERKTGRNYLMKVMRFDVIKKYYDGASSTKEYEFYRLNHKYVQKLTYYYRTEDLLVHGMEYPIGGCLGHYILGGEIHDEKIGAFYGWQLALAIIFLHSKNFILRSLTIHDLYLDHDGNLKLVDFGLSSQMCSKRYNRHIRQHPCYVAPELLQEKPYSFATDWWAYGVCCYVMVTGKEPFMKKPFIPKNEPLNKESGEPSISKEPEIPFVSMSIEEIIGIELEIYASIEAGLEFTSEEISQTAQDLLKKLLQQKPSRRQFDKNLGQELLEDEFFKKMKTYAFRKVDVLPPLKPLVHDTENSEDQIKGAIKLTPPRGGKEFNLIPTYRLPWGLHLHKFKVIQ